MTNREIAQEISSRIGNSPVPFDSVYSIALQIYNELGGEATQFDSVYSILLEILPLTGGVARIDDSSISADSTWSSSKIASEIQQGSGASIDDNDVSTGKTWSSSKISEELGNVQSDPIEEVSELPEASENKDKLFRLDNGEKDVYAAKLLSSETITTNRLPDAQQIDKAYLYTAEDDWVFKYKGAYTLECTDGIVNGYGWHYYDDSDEYHYFIITFDNAESIKTNSSYYWCETFNNVDFENKVIDVVDILSVSDVEVSLSTLDNNDYLIIPIPATYNAPESVQIGNAYLKETNAPSKTFIYEGLDTHLVEIGEGNWYRWSAPNYSEFYTTKPASEIYYYDNEGTLYFDFDVYDSNLEYKYNDTVTEFYIPQLNAPDSEQVDNAYISYDEDEYLYKGQYTLLNEDNSIYASNVAGFFGTGFMMFAKDWLPNEVYYQNIDRDDAITCDNPDEIELLPNNTIKVIDANVWNTHKVYDVFGDYGIELHPVKYQRTETTEEWGWEKVATEEYVDAKLSEKENKIDFTIGLNQTTPGAMPTLDTSTLNNVTTDGIYNIAIVSDVFGTGNEYFGTGKLVVQNLGEGNGLQQTLSLVSNYALPKQELIVRAYDGSDWTEQSYPCALIVPQGYEQVVPYATYSATKINELIAALDTRITALENA